MPGNNSRVRDSVLGRLLQELSWVGANIRDFHDGGLGFENVLTAEALTALDFLPRTDFLGAVLQAAHGAVAARSKAVAEIEQAEVTLFPDQLVLRPNAPTNQTLVVQPDGSVISPGSYVMLEAKRIRTSAFQPEQLAREYVALMREARGRSPLLLLILGSEPPVPVRGHGRMGIAEAISRHLHSVLDRGLAVGVPESGDAVGERGGEVVRPPHMLLETREHVLRDPDVDRPAPVEQHVAAPRVLHQAKTLGQLRRADAGLCEVAERQRALHSLTELSHAKSDSVLGDGIAPRQHCTQYFPSVA